MGARAAVRRPGFFDVQVPLQYIDMMVYVPVVSPGEAGFSRSSVAADCEARHLGIADTSVTKYAGGVGAARPLVITAAFTAVAMSVGGARPSGIAKCKA